MLKIIALIGARKNSKGIPDKNLADLGGHPLIAYSILAARLAGLRCIVSSDSWHIIQKAFKYGAEAIKRPKELATDTSPDIDWIKHAIKREKLKYDYIVHLRPTTPFRSPEIIKQAIDKIIKSKASSLRSAHELKEPPNKFFTIKGKYFKSFTGDLGKSNLPRQTFPPAYYPNGYVDIIKCPIGKTLHGNKILPFITEEVIEIDRPKDLECAKNALSTSEIYKILHDADKLQNK